MSDKNAFSGVSVPIAAASVIAIAAVIGIGLWVASPDQDAPSEAAQPLISETGNATPATEIATTQPETPSVEPKADTEQHSTEMADEPAAEQTGEATAQNSAPVVSEDALPLDIIEEQGDIVSAPSGADLDGPHVTVDIVRIPPQGITTVAGHAPANTDVVIYVDGSEVSRATTNARGEFVALFDLMASDAVREMTVGVVEGGKTTFADTSIVVAPAAKPVVAASADETMTDVVTEEAAETETPEPEVAAATPDDRATPIEQADPEDKAEPEEQAEASEMATAETPVAPAPTVSENAAKDVTAEPTDVAMKPAPVDQTPTVLKADDEGVKVIQQAGTNATSVRIDALTYDPEGRVFASGRAPSGAAIRLYLDTVLTAQTRAGEDGQWRVELKDVAAGVYTLRADQIDPDGTVVTRAETPFKREDVAVLAQIAGQVGQEGAAIAAKAKADSTNAETAISTTDQNSAQTSEAATQATADPVGASEQAATPIPPSRIASVTVQPGNTLWGIATESYGSGFLYARVFDANKSQIRDPDLIYPGQVFVLPE
ncbi:LysM peptidoglycan-binding domain-containing protein [Celeribacter sp.]|uniref:LysM peptidoglycan-binding domain-containing protein n=1 Tax=Celeribacter sp. TaxID=1890673 RepID=UPI003A8E266E